MAVLSSSSLLRVLSIFHVTIAYYLLASPSVLMEQNLVVILGAAMDIPLPTASLSLPTHATGLAALFLLTLAMVDMTSPSVDDEIGSAYWSGQAPIRVAFFSAITAGAYAGKFGIEKGTKRGSAPAGQLIGIREALCNSFVFSWAFLEMLIWFWIYTTVREERRELLARNELKRKEKEDRG